MRVTEQINTIFPDNAHLPAEYRLSEPVHQRKYLINGELHTWDGSTHEVLSPIFVNNADGLTQKVIIDEPIAYIVDSDHGQQVSIIGSDSDNIAHLIDSLANQVSRVNINAPCQRGPDTFPFTGRKDSAEGTLSVQDALLSFSIRTIVVPKQTDNNKQISTIL